MRRLTIKKTGLLPLVKRNPASAEQGLTLIEALAAIVIFGLCITAITSPMMFAMATRVRAHRAQQAMQIAQGEIDRVRLVLERGDLPLTQLNSLLPPNAGDGEPQDVGPPTTENTSCRKPPETSPTQPVATSPTEWCLVKLRADGEEFAVQTFRTKTTALKDLTDLSPPSQNPTPIGFVMGVRVYPKTAIDSQKTLSTKPMSLGFSDVTTGTAAPLVAIYTRVVRSDLPQSGEVYKKLLPDPNTNP